MILRRLKSQLLRARSMRHSMTKAEEILWRFLRSRGLGLTFRRQVPIGLFIADFSCLDAKLIVELNGPPYNDPVQQAHDRHRDAWLRAHGWRVVRIPNEIVFGGGDIVLDVIKRALHHVPSSDPTASGPLLPQAGEGEAERLRLDRSSP